MLKIRDPFLAAYLGLAAVINVAAVVIFIIMLASTQDAQKFGEWFPLSIATLHVLVASLAVVAFGLISRK
ncbi:MAG: hypothetical protein ACREMY_21750, partial [bacterium]